MFSAVCTVESKKELHHLLSLSSTQNLEISVAMAAWEAAARQAASLSRFSSPKSTAKTRSCGRWRSSWTPKVNCWQDPLTPSRWKEEHFVIVSLSVWGLLLYGGYKFFSGGKKDKMEEKITGALH